MYGYLSKSSCGITCDADKCVLEYSPVCHIAISDEIQELIAGLV